METQRQILNSQVKNVCPSMAKKISNMKTHHDAKPNKFFFIVEIFIWK